MEHWQIAPHKGLGPLKFGTTEAAAIEAAAVFGEVTHRDPLDDGPNEADEIYKALVEAEGEEVARQIMAEMLVDGVDLRTRRRVIVGEGLLLDFVDDGLEEITCTLRTPDVHIDGRRVFGVDCLPAMRRLQELNGAPPLCEGPRLPVREPSPDSLRMPARGRAGNGPVRARRDRQGVSENHQLACVGT